MSNTYVLLYSLHQSKHVKTTIVNGETTIVNGEVVENIYMNVLPWRTKTRMSSEEIRLWIQTSIDTIVSQVW